MYINISGQDIYYQKTGKGKDLVMLHGWGHDVSTWWGVIDLLKDNFTLWLIDLPGFGRSGLPQKPFTVKDYSEAVYGVIKELKIEKPILLGHSHGGRTAIKLAATYPDLLSKLILEDAAGIKPTKDALAYISYVLAKTFHFLMPNIGNIKDRIRQIYYRRLQSDYLDSGELKKTLINVINEDLTDDLAKIKTDTLLLWGEKDDNAETTVRMAKRMYRSIKNSRLEILEGLGHSPHLENPALFAYFVKDFGHE